MEQTVIKLGKHHKPHQLIALVILYCIMILCQPVSSSSCNYPVKKIKFFSEFTKGHIRIEGNKVIAGKSDYSDVEKNYLYKVTIDKHYMLLYHIRSAKFICWNKRFNRLVGRRNPTNLTYCKFEEKVSKIPDYRGSRIRLTTTDEKNREIEIRFNNNGAFARRSLISKCAKKKKLSRRIPEQKLLTLDPSKIDRDSTDMEAYRLLIKKCANPDFLTSDVDQCVSRLPEFCAQMKNLTDKGHSITSELMELCKNEWNRN